MKRKRQALPLAMEMSFPWIGGPDMLAPRSSHHGRSLPVCLSRHGERVALGGVATE